MWYNQSFCDCGPYFSRWSTDDIIKKNCGDLVEFICIYNTPKYALYAIKLGKKYNSKSAQILHLVSSYKAFSRFLPNFKNCKNLKYQAQTKNQV